MEDGRCEDGREIDLAKEFPAKEFGTSVQYFGLFTIVIRLESVRKFILKYCPSFLLEGLRK